MVKILACVWFYEKMLNLILISKDISVTIYICHPNSFVNYNINQ